MLPHKHIVFFLTILALVSGLSFGPWAQTSQEGRFFSETGHWVRGEFLEFYENTPDPLLLLGYPITEAFEHPQRPNHTIQYFQRARLELDPSAADGLQVRQAPLGEWLYDSGLVHEIADFPIAPGACRAIAPTGKNVCYAFLQFYDNHSGPTYLGHPISEVEVLDGRLVQYFQYARLEWRPEMPPGQRVALTDIGRLDFDITIGDEKFINARDNIPVTRLTQLLVHAFAEKPLITNGDRQTIFVVVQNQYLQPVEDALVIVTVRLPGGRVDNYRPDSTTNRDGFTQVSFDLTGLEPNQVVEVQVTVNIVNGPESGANTWFRIWW